MKTKSLNLIENGTKLLNVWDSNLTPILYLTMNNQPSLMEIDLIKMIDEEESSYLMD